MTAAVVPRPRPVRLARWWVGCARLGFEIQLAYREAAWMQAASMVLTVFLLTKIWTAVYAGAEVVDGLPLSALMVYLTLSTVQVYLTETLLVQRVTRRIREGTVHFDLSRPAPFLGQVVGLQLGDTGARLFLVAPALPVAVLVGSMSAPPSVAALAWYGVTLVLGYVVTVCVSLLVVLTAFWTLEASGMSLLVRLITLFFSGSMIPLVFFPSALRVVAEVLPFKLIAYVPASIYVGQLTGSDMYREVVVGAIWVIALSACVHLVWKRARRRVVVQGG